MSLATLVFWAFVSMSMSGSPPIHSGWIDRIEGNIAVIVTISAEGSFVEVPVSLLLLPVGVSEGDWIVDGSIDADEREAVTQRVLRLQRQLQE